MASLRLDFPQPFGPTTAATPLPENRISVRSQNDLNPWISIRLRMSKGVYLFAQAIGFGTSGAKAHAEATRGGDSKVTRCGLEVNNHGTGFWGCLDSTARYSRLARERYKQNHVHRPPFANGRATFRCTALHVQYICFQSFSTIASGSIEGSRQSSSRAAEGALATGSARRCPLGRTSSHLLPDVLTVSDYAANGKRSAIVCSALMRYPHA